MPRDVQIGTPENVPISYELAGLGSRSVAGIIDLTLQWLAMAALITLWALIERHSGLKLLDLPAKWLSALIGIAAFGLTWGYHFYFEAYRYGQTPGKRNGGLRVMREGGLPIDPTAAAIRNLVRVIDFLPVLYAFGAWVILVSPQCKRLGDYAAGTIVVKERVGDAPKPDPPAAASIAPEASVIRNASGVTSEEYQTIKRFVERQSELQPQVREQLARRIAEPLIQKLEIDISPTPNFRHSVFLTELQRRCQEERGFL